MSQLSASAAAEIVDLLARYAHVIDNRDWDEAESVFSADVQLDRPALATGVAAITGIGRRHAGDARTPWRTEPTGGASPIVT